ncbi:hypothetical protein MAR_004273, partial [Mya arenaria]
DNDKSRRTEYCNSGKNIRRSLAPEKICSTVQNIEEAFQKSACKPIGYITMLTWIVQQTDIKEMCTQLKVLLNCVAQSIFGWSELEKIELCVLHMRTALRNKRVDSMFATLPFRWESCERVWCQIRREYTDDQFRCIVRCLQIPAAKYEKTITVKLFK